jgi:hypothetical protein
MLRSPRRRTLSLATVVVLLAILTPLAFLALSSTDQAVDRAKAIVPLPPKPYLDPSTSRNLPRAHPSAGLCERDDVQCPDLAMRAPYQLVPDTIRGRRVLRVANAVMSIGAGPVEVRGVRSGALTMAATQYLRRPGHASLRVPGGAGTIVFKAIPAQGRIWKFQDAARFELWTTGKNPRLVRVGPKLIYCLRDLRRLYDWRRSPGKEVYPACSRSSKRTRVTLGTSPGWADIYPASYYQQWIDVTGLRGCFDLTHIADPKNRIIESDETNNEATTRIRLPMGRKLVKRC